MPQQLRLALVGLVFHKRNRHRAGWRFLRLITIVTVKIPMCNVIRMQPHPLSEGVASRFFKPDCCDILAVSNTTAFDKKQAPARERRGLLSFLRESVSHSSVYRIFAI